MEEGGIEAGPTVGGRRAEGGVRWSTKSEPTRDSPVGQRLQREHGTGPLATAETKSRE